MLEIDGLSLAVDLHDLHQQQYHLNALNVTSVKLAKTL